MIMKKIGIILLVLAIVGISCVSGSTIVIPSTQIANCYAKSGEPSVVNLSLDSAKDGLSGYKMKIGFTSGGIANIKSVSFPEWTNATKSVIGVLPGQEITVSAADLNNSIKTGSVNVPLCSLEIIGITAGNTSLNLQVLEMTNDRGKPIEAQPYPYSLIAVYSVPPLDSNLGAPRDLNHDGLLDDFNGNGRIDMDDVVVFFHSWSIGQTGILVVPPFDYNANGRIDVNDIVVFFDNFWIL